MKHLPYNVDYICHNKNTNVKICSKCHIKHFDCFIDSFFLGKIDESGTITIIHLEKVKLK